MAAGFLDDELGPARAYCEFQANFEELNVEDFREAFSGDDRSGAAFARRIVEESEYLPDTTPLWISRHIDYEGVWSELSHDYSFFNGFFFRNL